jgi:hypothetical protein
MNITAHGPGHNTPGWKAIIIAAVFSCIAILLIYGFNQQRIMNYFQNLTIEHLLIAAAILMLLGFIWLINHLAGKTVDKEFDKVLHTDHITSCITCKDRECKDCTFDEMVRNLARKEVPNI